MLADEGDPDIERRIYEAAVVPELWEGALASLARRAGSYGAILLTARSEQFRSAASPAIQSMWREWVREGWTQRSERAPRLLALDRPGWVRDIDILSLQEIETLPEYVEFLAPRGLKWGAAARVPMPTGGTAIFSMERLASQGAFEPETMARLDGLYGHLARAAMLSSLLSLERARNAVETLKLIGFPAAALSADGAVTVANQLFEPRCELWSLSGGDRLTLHEKRAARQLQDAFSLTHTPLAGRSIALQAHDPDDRAVLHLVPLRRSARDIFSGSVTIAIITKASREPRISPPLLRALFDLAPAEASIAADIAAGLPLDVIALKRKCTMQTLRSHLKSVRQKTGCRRQAELIALLTQLMPFNPVA